MVEDLGGDGLWVYYFGLPTDLIAAGVADPEMLELPPSDAWCGTDQFGDRFAVNRLAGGRIALARSLSTEPWHDFPVGLDNPPSLRFRAGVAILVVAEALARIMA